MRRLDLIVGPNGAGKSTFVELTLAPLLPRSVFVNADVIARQRWPDRAEEMSYEAAQLAAAARDRLLGQRRSFIAETVFSHPSKLELIDRAQAAGFTVVLHVMLVPEAISVRRVAHRVASGGHSVPEDKIRSRYRRLWPLIVDAIGRADQATVYDTASGTPAVIARFVSGVPVGVIRWPVWTPNQLSELG
ncbi:AAA family ATPase [Rhodococcus sp. HNM0563]|uniref:zeta toxin family protein n=1 Tax=unclassified Rhodococcus (in: high G+C Gram-positive bacteria) TaxID=192944 RepID=UPI00146B4294|nr:MULTISPECIES: zeta toxin family protein [unclassified Rhodococcus (in: high G+C Gram-positive bacteria)]MCK0093495.1 zeta toxin family protein [Rhodococcus sp. F64268]NLU64793.1 AAA family ATPase [Rhodococcus sp. HNM0563]